MAGHALCRFEVKPFSHESSEKKKNLSGLSQTIQTTIFYDCCIFKRFELMTMRLKKSLETSWNVDGKQLRELKSQ